MKLKGIELKGAYRVVYDTRSFLVYDEKDNAIYLEDVNDYWEKWEYDEKDNVIYFEDGNDYWSKSEYDRRGNVIYCEDSNGYWFKSEYDEKDNVIYCENSKGEIVDKRVKELTIKQIEKILGYKIKIKGETK